LDADSGREIGEVEGVLEAGGNLLLEVRSSGGEILIPFAKHICVEIAPENGVIRVRMPEGLEELNS
jgi:ribosomal 30S subunit maturation factor RimM